MTAPVAVVLALAVFLAACGGSDGPARKDDGARVVPGASEADAVAAPGRCNPREIARRLVRLFALSNRGDPAAADSFAPEAGPSGGWWSANGGGAAAVTVSDRDEFARYIATRHRRAERYALRELAVRPRGRHFADIEVKLMRRATDVSTGGLLAWNTEGKGAFDCARGAVVAWSVSTSPDDELTGPRCPRFSGRRRTVTACLIP